MKRAIQIQHNDDTPQIELNLTKAVKINVPNRFILIEEMPDGNWKLIYSGSLIPDFSKVARLHIHREDEQEDEA